MEGLGIFKNLTDIEVFKAGETIFNEGDTGNEMFVIQEGEVKISLHGSDIDTIGTGMPLEEMGLIDGKPRSPSVIAKTDCKLVRVDERRFKFLVQETPFLAFQLMRIIFERLRKEREL
jgi:CRP-like cAMP-binding protein